MFAVPTPSLKALGRLCVIAGGDTGQAKRIADFLLAWPNAPENSGGDPGDLGFQRKIEAIWRTWRQALADTSQLPAGN